MGKKNDVRMWMPEVKKDFKKKVIKDDYFIDTSTEKINIFSLFCYKLKYLFLTKNMCRVFSI